MSAIQGTHARGARAKRTASDATWTGRSPRARSTEAMSVSRLTSRYPERDEPRSPSIKPTARPKGRRDEDTKPLDMARYQRGDDPHDRADQDAGPKATPGASPEADAHADGEPAAHSLQDIGMDPRDCVAEGCDDDGDGGRNRERPPD